MKAAFTRYIVTSFNSYIGVFSTLRNDSTIQRFTLTLAALLFFAGTARANLAYGEKGMVVSVNPIATKAGVEVLKNGGNAVDAAVAVALTLGVVDGHNSGIGGGCFMLIRRANGAFIALDGREMAPGNAKRDMFLRNGKADPKLSQLGALASGVPGALATYDMAISKFGKTFLKDHLLKAAKVAEEGYAVDAYFANVTKNMADELGQFGESRAIFLDHGKPLKAGYILKQPDLAKTYRSVATNGIAWFYGGPFAKATEDWMQKNGGIMTVADFKNYQPVSRIPIFVNYRGDFTIATFPPPSSGGVHVCQILKMCEPKDLYKMRRNAVDVIHYIAEAEKLAFADRAHWLGDPDWVKVPMNLTAKKYCYERAALIQTNKVIEVTNGVPDKAAEEVFKSQYGKHTTHFSAVDAEGNWVACTATVNTSFGSKVVIPGTGVVMNNEMDDFAAEPGVPNFFGLVGAEANAVGPFKRPLSSMSPTIILKNGKPVLAVGAAGGPTIITQVAETIINYIDMGMRGGPDVAEMEISLEDALRTPRFHHQWKPDELRIETKWVEGIRNDLAKLGHKIKPVKSIGACQAIAIHPDEDKQGFVGASDPRGWGLAEGF